MVQRYGLHLNHFASGCCPEQIKLIEIIRIKCRIRLKLSIIQLLTIMVDNLNGGFADDFLSNGIYQLYRDEHELFNAPIDWSYYEDTAFADACTPRRCEQVPEFVEANGGADDPKSYSIIGEYIVPDLDVVRYDAQQINKADNVDMPSAHSNRESALALDDHDWDLSIENMLLDLDCGSLAADQPLALLPDRTLFCNDSCDAFLRESSDGLTSFFTLDHDELSDQYGLDAYTSPHWYHPTEPETTSPAPGDELIADGPSSPSSASPTSFPCTFGECCKIYAKPAHLKAHLRRHIGDKPYVCSWPGCTWKFSRSDELSRHRRSHSGVKPYKCGYCTKCFARSDHLTKHRKVHERKMAKHRGAGDATTWLAVAPGRPGRRPKAKLLVAD